MTLEQHEGQGANPPHSRKSMYNVQAALYLTTLTAEDATNCRMHRTAIFTPEKKIHAQVDQCRANSIQLFKGQLYDEKCYGNKLDNLDETGKFLKRQIRKVHSRRNRSSE